MAGAPCQLDLFDYKPKMDELFDKDLPESVRQGQRLTTMTSGQKRFPIAPSKFKFQQYGQNGTWVSELLPYTAKMVDDIADRQELVHRGDQSRSGDHLHLHRAPAAGPSQSGCLAQLRTGHAEREPAGLRRDDGHLDRPQGGAGAVQPPVGIGLPAQQASGRRAAQQGRSGAVPVQSRRVSMRPHAAACSTRWPAERQDVSATLAIRRRKRGSPSTRWRFACRRRCRN